MPYSYQTKKGEEKKIARAYGKEINVSRKHAREVCGAIRGKSLKAAVEYLERVVKKEDFVPLKRYGKKVPHRRGGVRGRFPVKAARIIIKLLKNAESNADYKSLDSEKLRVIHASAYKGLVLERTSPRGRASPSNIELTNIEIIIKEM